MLHTGLNTNATTVSDVSRGVQVHIPFYCAKLLRYRIDLRQQETRLLARRVFFVFGVQCAALLLLLNFHCPIARRSHVEIDLASSVLGRGVGCGLAIFTRRIDCHVLNGAITAIDRDTQNTINALTHA